MIVVFVHGWGVRTPDYHALPQRLRQAIGAVTLDVWLSDYISYSDSVTMSELAIAFERARQANFPGMKFACVTHSTVYAAAPQQFPRFRFVHFGQPAQPRTGAQVIAKSVFVSGRFPRFPFSHSVIVAQSQSPPRSSECLS